MTAEIAILNNRGVALAADSAVTTNVGGSIKVFPTANKLFALSKHHPVGVMVYNAAEMLGMPWEVAIKTYRQRLGKDSCPSLRHYARGFLEFLSEADELYPAEKQRQEALESVRALLRQITSRLEAEVREAMRANPQLPDEELPRILGGIIKANLALAEVAPRFVSVGGETWTAGQEEAVWANHREPVSELIADEFPFARGRQNLQQSLVRLALLALTRDLGTIGYTGLVFAGYGENDYFPALSAWRIYGLVDGKLRLVPDVRKSSAINHNNDAAIVPFAQSEMVATFIEGMDPSIDEVLAEALDAALDSAATTLFENTGSVLESEARKQLSDSIRDAVVKEVLGRIREFRRTQFIQPIVSVVRVLPKTELASMAESLVNLTSMKRRVSSAPETVGGPIDVALISKGDGFVWIRRKHYFDKDLNFQFFANYFDHGGAE
jgi:hypothetical protein